MSLCAGDCNDDNPNVHPGQAEIPCNGLDDDCDPASSDGFDADNDGVSACGGDCNDADPNVRPGIPEVPCNEGDDDCDPLTPDDGDGDSDGATLCGGDCNDADPAVHPGAAERPCNDLDDDCDPLTPDAVDGDGDGVTGCAGDCADANPDVFPGQPETLCNEVDDDCDPLTPDDKDGDRDGVTLCGGDCNDANPDVLPGQPEIPCDDLDNNCSGEQDENVDFETDERYCGDCDTACSNGQTCEAGQCRGALCPADMVRVTDFCIDRYEASRPDATATEPGTDESRAKSRPGVIPWHVSTMSAAVLQTYEAACTAAGKRLCRADEWYQACTGPDNFSYSWGNTWDREICNCVDAFCDDYCATEGIPDCNTNENCGYQYACYHVVPTGQFPECVAPYGGYDTNGNVWEVVLSTTDPRGYEVRGGAFNCAGPSQRLLCTFNAGWNQLFAGFRCCL